jgi:hypothetical protein
VALEAVKRQKATHERVSECGAPPVRITRWKQWKRGPKDASAKAFESGTVHYQFNVCMCV